MTDITGKKKGFFTRIHNTSDNVGTAYIDDIYTSILIAKAKKKKNPQSISPNHQ